MAGPEQGASPEEKHLNGELLVDTDEREGGAVGPGGGGEEGAKKKRKKKKKGKGAAAGQETERDLETTLDEVTKQMDKQTLEEKEKDDEDEDGEGEGDGTAGKKKKKKKKKKGHQGDVKSTEEPA